MNRWMKRAIGVAALGGGLLALGAGAASAQEVSVDAQLGRPTSAEVRVCADGRVLSGLLGSCSGQSGSGGTSATVQAGRDSDGSAAIRARVRAPRVASADVALGTRRSRPRAAASGQATVTTPRSQADADAAADTSPRAAVTAKLSRSGDGRLLELRPLVTLAGIGVLGSGPIASGNQVDASVGDVSPSVPVTVCGNSVGVLGDAAGSCGTGQQSTATGPASGPGTSASVGNFGGSGSSTDDSLLGDLASGNQVDAGIGSVSPSVPVTVCGNGVGVLGDASASCGSSQPGSSTSPSAGSGSDASTQAAGTIAGNQVEASAGDVSPSVPVTACGNSVGVLGDASAACGAGQPASGGSSTGSTGPARTDVSAAVDVSAAGASTSTGSAGGDASIALGGSTDLPPSIGANTIGLLGDGLGSVGADISTGGIIAPAPGTTPEDPSGQTGTDGTPGTGRTDSAGTTGTAGLIPGTSGLISGAGDPITTFAPQRPFASGSGALPFTGAASDLLAMVAAGLLVAGALTLRAARPASVREGGDGR